MFFNYLKTCNAWFQFILETTTVFWVADIYTYSLFGKWLKVVKNWRFWTIKKQASAGSRIVETVIINHLLSSKPFVYNWAALVWITQCKEYVLETQINWFVNHRIHVNRRIARTKKKMKTKSHILSVNMSEWRYHLNINHLKLS